MLLAHWGLNTVLSNAVAFLCINSEHIEIKIETHLNLSKESEMLGYVFTKLIYYINTETSVERSQ